MPKPRVTILLPVLNEASFIDECLRSLAAQDYQGDVEVIVADGGSNDGTPELVSAWNESFTLLEVIDNPEQVQSHGLNLAAERSSGKILIRADAHSTYAPDYVRESVETLLSTEATVVGGVQASTGRGRFGQAVAEAMGIPLAAGPARFRSAGERVQGDTVYLGAFRKADWERLGGWRTLPSRVAEDADLYFRWRQQGAQILVEPTIRSSYVPRDTPAGLWRQFFRYGLGKADMLYVNGRWPSWRPTAPLVLVLGLALAIPVGFAWSWWPLVLLLVLWQGAIAVAVRGRPLTGFAASIMHLSYGLGLLRGLLRWPASVREQVV